MGWKSGSFCLAMALEEGNNVNINLKNLNKWRTREWKDVGEGRMIGQRRDRCRNVGENQV